MTDAFISDEAQDWTDMKREGKDNDLKRSMIHPWGDLSE